MNSPASLAPAAPAASPDTAAYSYWHALVRQTRRHGSCYVHIPGHRPACGTYLGVTFSHGSYGRSHQSGGHQSKVWARIDGKPVRSKELPRPAQNRSCFSAEKDDTRDSSNQTPMKTEFPYTKETGFLHSTGELAYVDTSCGLLPCKVLTVPKGGPFCGWLIRGHAEDDLTVRLTATRGAFKTGEVLKYRPSSVIPRDHVFTSSYQYRIRTNYSWQ
jgi:hypothetical protein